jgi:hypothetical protein
MINYRNPDAPRPPIFGGSESGSPQTWGLGGRHKRVKQSVSILQFILINYLAVTGSSFLQT